MILTCPACATRYETDAAKFPPQGRQVRCAKCGNNWHQPGPEAEIAPQPEPAAADIAAAAAPEAAPVRIDPPQPVSRPRAVAPPAAPKERTPLLPLLGVALGWVGL